MIVKGDVPMVAYPLFLHLCISFGKLFQTANDRMYQKVYISLLNIAIFSIRKLSICKETVVKNFEIDLLNRFNRNVTQLF